MDEEARERARRLALRDQERRARRQNGGGSVFDSKKQNVVEEKNSDLQPPPPWLLTDVAPLPPGILKNSNTWQLRQRLQEVKNINNKIYSKELLAMQGGNKLGVEDNSVSEREKEKENNDWNMNTRNLREKIRQEYEAYWSRPENVGKSKEEVLNLWYNTSSNRFRPDTYEKVDNVLTEMNKPPST